MAGFQPFDYGNAILKAEQINNARMKNAIAQRDFNNPASIDGPEPAKIRVAKEYQRLIDLDKANAQAGNPTKLAQNFLDATRQNYQMLNQRDRFTPANVQTGQVSGQSIPINIAPHEKPTFKQQQSGAVEQGKQDVRLKTEPKIKAANIKAEAEAERTLPENIQASQLKAADNLNAYNIVSDFLIRDKSGKYPMVEAAFGRPNVMAPDFIKPQSWVDAEAQKDQVLSLLHLENVKKLKGTGPITEPEQKVLRQAATVLANPLISPELVVKEMKRVQTMFAKWASDNKKLGMKTPISEQIDNDPLGIR